MKIRSSPTPMWVLVDYDNIPDRADLEGVVDRIVRSILTVESPGVLKLRLYGGWYLEESLTPQAIELGSSIGRFPRHARSPDGQIVTVRVELASALLAVPGHLLTRTFRMKQAPTNLRCAAPLRDCKEDGCPLIGLPKLLRKRRCPGLCERDIDALVSRNEQKMVDVMLASDLGYLAGWNSGRAQTVAIVSSDDDFLPAVYSAVSAGLHILRLLPKGESGTPLLPGIDELFTQIDLE